MARKLSDKLAAPRPGDVLGMSELASMRRQAEDLEESNASLRSQRKAPLRVLESRTYQPDGRYSFFVDLARAEYRSDEDAKRRLAVHRNESTDDEVRRLEARARAADRAYERAFYSTPRDRMLLDAFVARGGTVFETRAATRTETQGSAFTLPAWLVDQYVPPARAGTEFSSLWTTLPLPEKCSSVSVPIMSTGSASGPQADIAPAPTRDIADSFASEQSRTILGQVDAAAQWLDQGTGAVGGQLDQIIYNDLMADAALQLDGMCLLGGGNVSGAPGGQARGVWPGGQISTSLGVQMVNTNNNATQTWVAAGGSGTTLHADLGRLLNGIHRARGKTATHIVSNPFVWYLACSTVDGNGRPLLNLHSPGEAPRQAADGVLGISAYGIPWVGSPNVATTFGGVASPALGAISGAQFAGQPGTGGNALYTPVWAGRPADLFMWLGDPQIRLLREALAGNAQVRFQLWRYVVLIPDRYRALTAGTLPNSGGWTAGAPSAFGTLTQQTANGILQVVAQNF
jgi:hypothetical protein